MYGGKFAFKIDWASILFNLPFFFVLLWIWGQFSKYKPQGAYIWRGDLAEGLLRYKFWGLIFEGAYTRRGLFSEFYGIVMISENNRAASSVRA